MKLLATFIVLFGISCHRYTNRPRVIRNTVTAFLVEYCRAQSIQMRQSGQFSEALQPSSHSAPWREIELHYYKVVDVGYVCDARIEKSAFSVHCQPTSPIIPMISFFVNETNILRVDFEKLADSDSPTIFPDLIETRRMEGK